MSRQLIVNADDFGRTRGVSAGILRAHLDGHRDQHHRHDEHAGRGCPICIRRGHEAPRLGLGVHLNFTAGRPLLPTEWCASLVDEHGHFLTQRRDHGAARSHQSRRAARGIEVADHDLQECAGPAARSPGRPSIRASLSAAVSRSISIWRTSFKLPLRIPFPQHRGRTRSGAADHRAMCRSKR